MKCPHCGETSSSVVDSRLTREGREIRRRRECEHCKQRFTTYERIEEREVLVVKKDGRREPFNRDKIRSGLYKACEKIPIASDAIEQSAIRVARRVSDLNKLEVASDVVGRFVMEELFQLDEVAYLRFASVYLRFQDISEFTSKIEELRRMKKNQAKKKAEANEKP